MWLSAGLLVLGLVFHREIAAAVDGLEFLHSLQPLLPDAAHRRLSRLGQAGARCAACGRARYPRRPWPAFLSRWFGSRRSGSASWRAADCRHQLRRTAVPRRTGMAATGGPWPARCCNLVLPGAVRRVPHPQAAGFHHGFVQVGLNLLNIPVYIDGYTIEIPQGSFYIAEACAGLRFLIASIAFGALYSLVMYRSPLRRTCSCWRL